MDKTTLKEKLQSISKEVYSFKLKRALRGEKEILIKNVFLNKEQLVDKILSMLEKEDSEISEIYLHSLDVMKKSTGHYEVVLKLSVAVSAYMLVKKRDSSSPIQIPINQVKTLEVPLLEFYTTEFFV